VIPQYTVHTLRLGTIQVPKSATVQGASADVIEIPVWAAAIEGNGHKLIVDTGIRDAERWQHLAPHALDRGETLDGRLAELGWTTTELDMVINSHLHYDHADNNLALPHAQFFVSRAEWEWAADPSSAQAPLYDLDWTGPDLTYMNYTLVDSDHYEVLPGIRLVQTPGHTPGHQSVLVNTDEGILCIAGDAACLMENLSIPAPPGTHVSSRAALDSIDKICRLSDRILMNHDPELTQFQNCGFPETPASPPPGSRTIAWFPERTRL
jgi:N-acyl homoserine lactone hydrolase